MTLILKLAGRPEPLPQCCPSSPPGRLSHGPPCCAGSGPPAQSLLKTRLSVSNCETVDGAIWKKATIVWTLDLSCPSLNHGETAWIASSCLLVQLVVDAPLLSLQSIQQQLHPGNTFLIFLKRRTNKYEALPGWPRQSWLPPSEKWSHPSPWKQRAPEPRSFLFLSVQN